ncbi:MAG TPA: thermonuclease family protein [Treponemataceae bacterium]|nr:thermonuclease family protein [Treponemataceae bacterium]
MKTISHRARVAVACVLAALLAVSCAADDSGLFVTKTGTKYHLGSCKALSKSKIPITLEDAIARGYTPCELCHPPAPHGDVPGTAASDSAATPGAVATSGAASSANVPFESRETPFTLEGTVVSVTDGDTVVVLSGNEQCKIRLNGIDCPEHNQAYGQKAKEYTASLIAGKAVSVTVTDRDRYGRFIGEIVLDGASVNASIVEAGYAWQYREYSKDANLARLEREAREAKRGLWQDANPVAPWDFRKGRK